ncbi:MAG TPA: radical SAM protein [Methylophilaceae bacterium]|nr:radical SAM protein [Methylophilaceae bacterium]HQC28441.1 radical SAM protein [Methylotenera sp.]
MSKDKFLTVVDHNRDVSGLKYVYPVVSRRAGGVSIGINLNTNNACNWRCVYCSVPNLTRGTPPPIELSVLEQELRTFLNDVLHGDFMLRHVAEADRQLMDIAFSGNGEPTSAKEFPEVLLLVEKILRDFDLIGKIKIRLITNGSLMDKPSIISSMRHLAQCNGEVWFKLDAGTKEGIARINDVNLSPHSHLERLKKCAAACPTYIQTCMFALDGLPPTAQDIADYLTLISQVKEVISGVHLYGLARPSYQAEAPRLSRLSADWLENVANRIRELGLNVFVNP